MKTKQEKPKIQYNKLYNKRNFWCFALGEFGREFSFAIFGSNLLTFILFTKTLNAAQFSAVTMIIIGARLFDAVTDPIMGGIVENTRSRLGKFRPWILAGGVSTALITFLVFSIGVDNWGFIVFLGIMYFTYSITFTMNDIAYWSLLPHLARGTDERNKLSAAASLISAAGAGLPTIIVPAVTTTYSAVFGGSARSAYMWISLISLFMYTASTLVTFFGVQDHTEVKRPKKKGKIDVMAENAAEALLEEEQEDLSGAACADQTSSEGSAPELKSEPSERLTVKKALTILKNNDQLLISAIIFIIFSIGTSLITNVLIITYVYFSFGYNGLLLTIFSGIGWGLSNAFVAVSPAILKKLGRTVVTYAAGLCIVIGFALMLIVGLTVPNGDPVFSMLGIDFTLKFILMLPCYDLALIGQAAFTNMMFLNISNTVEYNEWKTGKRNESLIYSIRPFTGKISAALVQLLTSVVYMALGILNITNGISELDKQASLGEISNTEMLTQVDALIKGIPQGTLNAFLCCICLIPIIFVSVCLILYKTKFVLTDANYERIKQEIANGTHPGANLVNQQEETVEAN